MKSLMWNALLIVAGLLNAESACRAGLLVDFSSYTGTPFSDDGNRVIGYTFTVGAQPLYVTALGYFDEGANGLNQSHDVGLYVDSTQTLLTSATVPSGLGARLSSWFRMVDLTQPVQLAANTRYVVAGTCPGFAGADTWFWRPDTGDGYNQNLVGFTLAPEVTVDPNMSAKFNYYGWGSASLSYPASFDNNNNAIPPHRNYFIGPDFEFSPVPEPSQAILYFSIGVCGLGCFLRWRETRTS